MKGKGMEWIIDLTFKSLSTQELELKHITHATIHIQWFLKFPKNRKKGWNPVKKGEGMKWIFCLV
jgi:hypothetical protein